MPDGFAKLMGAGFRDPDKLVTSVTRHLLKSFDTDRRTDCIHPSEMSHEHWCPRSTYYRISGVPFDQMPISLAMEMVFGTGDDAHLKWQRWFREMGVLGGAWFCQNCGNHWDDISPYECPRCEAGSSVIDYAEVPVFSDEFLIAGHGDGDVYIGSSPRLIEIKTIGTGTVRWEAPKLVEQYSYKHKDESGKLRTGTDWNALWRGIHRPFPAHLKQGNIYCFCTGRDEIVYIYDPKFVTANPKEFEVGFSPEIVRPLLEQCTAIKNALEAQRPPKRPMWAEPKHAECKRCPFRATCWGDRLYDEA